MLDMRDRAAGLTARPPQNSSTSDFQTDQTDLHAIPDQPEFSALSNGGHVDARSVGRSTQSLDDFLSRTPFDANRADSVGEMLGALVAHGFDRLPLPGSGQTLARWRALAAVAARDLGLVKLFEGHTDALAILAELHGPAPQAGSRWGVWAAEPPDARVTARIASGSPTPGRAPTPHAQLTLNGTKAWCSGAQAVSHALVTVWLHDEPLLAAVEMNHPSIAIDTSHWQAVGMQATASADVAFHDTPAILIGTSHAYVQRPGFWQGGAGIAACWYGAAAQIGRMLRDACAQRADPHRLAHLGEVDVALSGAAAVLRETAARIDANPHADAQREATRARLVVEAAATATMTHATRTLGAGPLCRDAHFARLLADLPVFLRQSHAERDLAALGELTVKSAGIDARGAAWTL